MSYDYNDLVKQISSSRNLAAVSAAASKDDERIVHLQTAVDAFERLSASCPMTPLLWMQYSADTAKLVQLLTSMQRMPQDDVVQDGDDDPDIVISALETRLQLLELGLTEFPGSAILHLHYLELLSSLVEKAKESNVDNPDQSYAQKYHEALENALQKVGQGSHRNEGSLIAKIYILLAKERAASSSVDGATTGGQALADEAILDCFVRRAKTPMRDVNSGLTQEFVEFWNAHTGSRGSASHPIRPIPDGSLQSIEEGRRSEAKIYSSLVSLEDDADVAMHSEGILARIQIDLNQDPIDWDRILSSEEHTPFWSGLGGTATANAFIQYAQGCYRFRSSKMLGDLDEEEQLEIERQINSLAPSVYERGIAEAPTVEALWLSYLRHLLFLVHHQQQQSINTTSPTNTNTKLNDLLAAAKGVVDRAVRNCPYSVSLFQQKLQVALLLANAGQVVLDPEELLTKVVMEEALGSKFITSPDAAIQLFMTVIQVVRRRILYLLAQMKSPQRIQPDSASNEKKGHSTELSRGYDVSEPIKLKAAEGAAIAANDEISQELEDLCADLRESYDEIDANLRKQKGRKSDEGRSILWKDRAITETHLLGPLMATIADSATLVEDRNMKHLDEVVQSFEKATRVAQPAHPTVFVSYVEAYLTAFPVTPSPVDVLSKLQQTRWLYQKALKSVGKAKEDHGPGGSSIGGSDAEGVANAANLVLDYETSLRWLCQNYLLFENLFGSDKSYADAYKAIEKKLAKTFQNGHRVSSVQNTASQSGHDDEPGVSSVQHTASQSGHDDEPGTAEGTKRTHDAHDDDDDDNDDEVMSTQPPQKKQKESHSVSTTVQTTEDGELAEERKAPRSKAHKVKVGNLEYPAHPFTIRVSYLSPKTEDMDLVDAFRNRVGPIVHARVMREKPGPGHHQHNEHKGKSKGWGLVQFEDRESVEKALALSDVIGIHEKLVKIERSHLPAVGLVPPGMHRVNPKGEGKSTKRNMKRKEKEVKETPIDSLAKDDEATTTDAPSKAGKEVAPSTSILAFRPRVVHPQTAKQRKAKISLSAGQKDD